MIDKVEDTLDKIANEIYHCIENNDSVFANCSLYGGDTGVLIFLAHYSRHKNRSYDHDMFTKYLDTMLVHLSNTQMHSMTYSSGLAGTLFALKYLNKNFQTDIDYSDIELHYQKHMLEYLTHYLNHNYYDFMHGGLGITYSNIDNPYFLAKTCELLQDTAIKIDNMLKWKTTIDFNQQQGYNIALSHGVSGLISVLSHHNIDNTNTEYTKTRQIIAGSINYILSQELDNNIFGCHFPSQSIENNTEIIKSRLGWCYGDLGIATTLLQAGLSVGKKEWINKAVDISIFSSYRRNLEDNQIFDAGICHGSAGVAMMFNYLYSKTKEECCIKAYNYWIETTLKFARYEDGLAGYKKYTFENSKVQLINDYTLLEGISGIGLVLLGYLNPNDNTWTEFFLLN